MTTLPEHVENLEYNSERSLLVIPEYGRNVQKLIRHGKGIEDRDERQAYMERLVDLMLQMSPQNKNLDDYKDRLWRHVFRIGGYDLDVTPPNGTKPTPEEERKMPDIVGYPNKHTRFKHYGNNVQNLIDKALTMEPGPIRQGFVEVIGNYMKMAYKTWNREHYVSDEIIIQDLESLSKGQLTMHEDASLDMLANANRRKKRTHSSNNKNSKNHKKGGSKGGNNRKRRRRDK
ncbi:MAG: DUF4290 domain-containing protein [Bacteroidota bacterium]